MPDFFSPEGLSLLQDYESSGNPEATNPSSSASGLYGFINSTWATYAPQAGVDISQYPTAASAPAAVQTQVASITPASNWLCPGCDAGITNAVANNPSLLTSSPSEVDNPTYDPNTGIDWGATLGAQGGAVQSPAITPSQATSALSNGGWGSGFWSQLLGDVENLASRAGLVLIAIVLLAAAAYAMSEKSA